MDDDERAEREAALRADRGPVEYDPLPGAAGGAAAWASLPAAPVTVTVTRADSQRLRWVGAATLDARAGRVLLTLGLYVAVSVAMVSAALSLAIGDPRSGPSLSQVSAALSLAIGDPPLYFHARGFAAANARVDGASGWLVPYEEARAARGAPPCSPRPPLSLSLAL